MGTSLRERGKAFQASAAKFDVIQCPHLLCADDLRWAEGELVGERGEARVRRVGSGSHAWDGDSVRRAGTGNFRLGHASAW